VADCRWIEGFDAETLSFSQSAKENLPLTSFERILMRKDPPFDIEYVYATYLLEAAESPTTQVINGPQGLRDCNEKLYSMLYPDLLPETLVSRDPSVIADFVRELAGPVVVKPLDLMGGRGIILVNPDDHDLQKKLESSSQQGSQRLMAQRFLEEAREGDKRIILVDGKAIMAFVRKPAPGDFRGNLTQGATAHKASIDARDEEIIAAMASDLLARGQRFVGIDIIGRYLTEVNVTSPMGLRELDELYGCDSADMVIAALER
jgi:glutathione synthase